MLLAELEVWHSRPIAPTRRIALGHLALPVEPPPGFGGLLLGGVVAAHIGGLDAELVPDLHVLIGQVEAGQVDRHGLARSRHRLVGKGEEITFDFEENGSPTQQILGAVYAAERLDVPGRKAVCAVLHKAVRWNGGPVGPSLIAHLSGVHSASVIAFANPVVWALNILGFAAETRPSKRQVQARFRARLMDVHPDHGGDEVAASTSIAELGEARRVLLG